MLERISVLLPEVDHELLHLGRDVRQLDGIGLDMNHGPTALLTLELKVDHEQRPALGDDVVLVPRIPEGVVEAGGGQPVHGIDDGLHRSGEILGSEIGRPVLKSLDEGREGSVQNMLGLLPVMVLDVDAALLQIAESLSVRTEEVQSLDRRRVHRGDVEQPDVRVHAGLGVDSAALPDVVTLVLALRLPLSGRIERISREHLG